MPNANEGDTSQNGADSAEKKYLTADDLDSVLEAKLSKIVNAAVSSHTKRIAKDFDEKLSKLSPKPKESGEDDAAQGDDAADKANAKPGAQQPANAAGAKTDPELDKLRKQLEALTAKQREAEKRAAESERRRIETEGMTALRSTLTGKVAAGAEDAVVAMLRGRNAVAIGDDGAVRLKLRASADEPEDGLDLSDGIAAFLKTPEAKFFVPAPNGGAGGTFKGRMGQPPPSGGNRQPSATDDPVEAFERATGKRLFDVLRG